MKVETIEVIVRKSGRKNAKEARKECKQWDDAKGAKFSLHTLYTLAEFMAYAPYDGRYIVRYESYDRPNGPSDVHREYLRLAAPERWTIEQAINDVYMILKTLHAPGIPATLAAVYEDPNIRYLLRANAQKEA